MNLNGWHVRKNIFTKSFMDYVVEVKEVQPKHIGEDIRVTIWKDKAYEDTKHTKFFDNFEQAFKFVEDIKRISFEDVVKEFFNG